MVRIRLISDLHLEMGTQLSACGLEKDYPLEREAMILIIAGDLAPLCCPLHAEYLQRVCQLYKKVIYIAGNHEYYEGVERRIGIDRLREVFKALPELLHLNNLITLDNGQYELTTAHGRKVQIIGTTLWSNIPAEKEAVVLRQVRDYRNIYGSDGYPLTVAKTNHMHRTAVQYLQEMISRKDEILKVVVSHHAPSSVGTSAPGYSNSACNCAFATDLPGLVERVDLWLFGHTHYQYNYWQGTTRLGNCPLGYAGEKVGTRWSGVIDLDHLETVGNGPWLAPTPPPPKVSYFTEKLIALFSPPA